ncbi:histidine kinase (plasmid) [Rhodococcus antarcticus]|uniref:histidine kinase n=1 Tax=Rhodococcus antarcticus TaxID=2987751 RepID=A0ABY6P6S7_9NOCA|nr:histidine kinase [Rhodococcus antarcticus]UZJ26828.1 histidine kinase [Rhodococcus antarcticus]
MYRSPAVRDRVLAAVVLLGAVVEAFSGYEVTWRPGAVVLGAVLAAAVLVRRSRPATAVVSAFGTLAAVDLTTYLAGEPPVRLTAAVVVLVLLYALFRWGSFRGVLLGSASVAAGFAVAVLTDPTGVQDALGGATVLALAGTLGAAVRVRVQARAQLVDRARLQEREQLARELHDTVAHHVCAIVVQAQAGLVLGRRSCLDGAVDALDAIEGEATRTLSEMRAIVGGLRTERHGLADLEGLVGRSGALQVALTMTGDLDGLPPAVESTIYRVAQESLSNATLHASRATRVSIEVVGTRSEVQLRVVDDGNGASSTTTTGFGLVGMRERVTLLGGTFTAGPRASAGWAVCAELPRGAAR